MRLLIVSSHPSILKWKTLNTKLAQLKAALNKTQNATWQIHVTTKKLEPEVVNSRITHAWYDNFRKQYPHEFIYLHFSSRQWKRLGLDHGVLGINQRDTDFIGESYGWSDENTLRKKTKENQFIQNVLHEMSHELARTTKVTDETHIYHDANPDISTMFTLYDMSQWNPELQAKITHLERLKLQLAALLGQKPSKLLPLVERRANAVLEDMRQLGYEMRITQGLRSIEEQNKLYAQGRTAPGKIVTNAKGGDSYHQWGVAVDYVFRKQGYNVPETVWQTFGKIGEKHGFEWGGSPAWIKAGLNDRPHLQLTLGYSLKDFKEGKVDYTKFN